LARRGYAILLHYHSSADRAERTAGEIEGLGVPAYSIRADLATDGGLSELFTALDARLAEPDQRLMVVVNSAAVMRRSAVRDLSPAEWDETFSLNLRAAFFVAQGAAQRMPQGGLIVHVSDAGAGRPWIRFPAYTVSKAALETLTRLLAKAYAPHLRVNAIAPGLVLPSERVSREEWDALVDRLPLGRAASEQEIVRALDFLLDDEYVTGQILVLDGGYTLT
jgi:NAD(P)-dependent dehydrogenase (short-subunit alcohol dehydrogenase family)